MTEAQLAAFRPRRGVNQWRIGVDERTAEVRVEITQTFPALDEDMEEVCLEPIVSKISSDATRRLAQAMMDAADKVDDMR